ncbi:MAG TPA: BlaI/MecI/CopY family transcriptional regulator [Longimicrobiales bacterium]|nr:BlaI/MecI/CopY family transcriptional regulator [Longimicrobiales bacterium]
MHARHTGNGATPLPTDAELGILHVLWRRGPSTVRQVLEELPRERAVGYTTVLKLLQIMHEKALVERDESERSHRYRAAVGEGATQRRLVGDLIDRGFQGSAARLVLGALSARRTTPEELGEIRRLLDELGG